MWLVKATSWFLKTREARTSMTKFAIVNEYDELHIGRIYSAVKVDKTQKSDRILS